MVPFGSLLGIVCLAAVHEWLGAPLGASWGAELWTLVKTGALVVVPTYWGLAAAVSRHNARTEALYADRAAQLERLRASYDTHPAASLTDGRRPTDSHPALHPAASQVRPLVVVPVGEEE